MNHPEYYLNFVSGWEDPNPKPVIEEIDGYYVVRDDLLGWGSKIRFIDYLIKNSPAKEFVYGSAPRWGYGSVSAAYVCKKYNKKFTLFICESKNWHPNQEKTASCGANIIEVKMGMLTVTQSRARKYCLEKKDRMLIPMGLEDDTVFGSIIKVARNMDIKPKEFWTVGGSGTLNRGLQLAWPKANANVVQVGHALSPREIGRAEHWISPYKFPQHVKPIETPPYNSVPEYDAKIWPYVKSGQVSKGSLIWNVA